MQHYVIRIDYKRVKYCIKERKKKRPILHKPWPIQTIADCQDSCTMSRQLQTVNTVVDCQGYCGQLQTFADMSVSELISK